MTTSHPSPDQGLPCLGDLVVGGRIVGARPYQEDSFRIRELGFRDRESDGCDLLMVVADGMGGHAGGAEASTVAADAFVDAFVATGGNGVTARLRASLDSANAAVGARAAQDHALRGMGCTLVACVITDLEEAHWVSVGDSPLWLARPRAIGRTRLDRLNEDHSMQPVFDALVRRGQMTEEEARGGSHQLRSAVMGGELPLVDEGAPAIPLKAGDRLLLASDGVESLSEDEIARLCGGRGAAADIVDDLLEAVDGLALPSQDNATAVVYRHVQRSTVRRRLEGLTAPTQPGRLQHTRDTQGDRYR